jgi:hypothetical protein
MQPSPPLDETAGDRVSQTRQRRRVDPDDLCHLVRALVHKTAGEAVTGVVDQDADASVVA